MAKSLMFGGLNYDPTGLDLYELNQIIYNIDRAQDNGIVNSDLARAAQVREYVLSLCSTKG